MNTAIAVVIVFFGIAAIRESLQRPRRKSDRLTDERFNLLRSKGAL